MADENVTIKITDTCMVSGEMVEASDQLITLPKGVGGILVASKRALFYTGDPEKADTVTVADLVKKQKAARKKGTTAAAKKASG